MAEFQVGYLPGTSQVQYCWPISGHFVLPFVLSLTSVSAVISNINSHCSWHYIPQVSEAVTPQSWWRSNVNGQCTRLGGWHVVWRANLQNSSSWYLDHTPHTWILYSWSSERTQSKSKIAVLVIVLLPTLTYQSTHASLTLYIVNSRDVLVILSSDYISYCCVYEFC